MLVDNALKSQ